MKKYNRNKRASYKTHARKIEVHDACDTHDTCDTHEKHDTHDTLKSIHIHVLYDGYNRTPYDNKCIPATPRKDKTRIYIGMLNAMHDIFDTPKQHTHRANGEYHAFIPQHDTDYMPPEHMMETYTRTYTETKRVKCIIFNTHGDMIHYGTFRRTIYMHNNSITYTLHRADRSIEVKPYHTAHTIKGYTEHELHMHDVELYQV